MTVTNESNGSIILFLYPSFLELLVYDKGINFQRPANGRCPASGRSGGHEADDHQSAMSTLFAILLSYTICENVRIRFCNEEPLL